MSPDERVRLDKWLWAARFFKTRALAAEEIGRQRVLVNGHVAKASRELKAGDEVQLRHGEALRIVTVRALSLSRGPASVAQALYEETAASLAAREARALQRRIAPEPALSIELGRPTKRHRRKLAEWDRWSASLEK